MRRVAFIALAWLLFIVACLGGWLAGPSTTLDLSVPSYRVPVNLADRWQLQLLPGIGPAMAGRVIRQRDRSGPFDSARRLQSRVSGIGPMTIEQLKPWIRFGEPGSTQPSTRPSNP